MSEVLSQKEIDELIGLLSEGTVTEELPEVIPYDFKQPNKFSKDLIRSIERIFDQLSRTLSTSLSMQTRTRVTSRVVSVEQLSYDEFLRSIPNPCIVAAFGIEPLPGTALMEMGIDIGLVLFDILCGGPGQIIDQRGEPTDIQLRVLRHLIKTILQRDLPIAWHDVVALEPTLQNIETNSEYLQINAPEEVGILATLGLQAGQHEGSVNFFMAHSSLEGIMSRLQRGFRGRDQSRTSVDVKDLGTTELAYVRVPVELELGSAGLTFSEVVVLEKGDVILLGDIDQPSVVRIAGLSKFQAVPGVHKGRMAGKITGIWEGETDE
ncbi:MAG: flagellar motor switch protein FliM [Limnochordia bacterium]|nr:flagellar motor switch protein FliM [Limnochordia bacterium]MDD4518084.1 flagellar motor switch protein FliM [Limnochordia bacterium]